MKRRKRETMFLAGVCILLIIILACVVLLTINAGQKAASPGQKNVETLERKGEDVQEADNEKRELEFEDFYLLESFLTVKQIEGLEGEITEFLAQDPGYGMVGKVTCKEEAASTENRLEFYCILDDGGGTALRAVYDKNSGEFRFWTEAVQQERIGQELKEKQDRIVKTEDWEEEGKLPSEWTYKEEDNTPVTLSGKTALEGMIPEERLEQLEAETLSFLEKGNEYRREIEIQKDPKDTAIAVEFWGRFKTSRLDGKELHVVYDKDKKSYQFAFQEE